VVNASGDWEFRPMQSSMRVKPGKLYNTSYYAKNLAQHTVIGQAVPSVAPLVASKHFSKTECFCFTRQVFEAGAEKDMPLTFVIDPAIPASVEMVTLSYTFFDTGEKPES
jgi:cytochrome c oxidase assembly protein subunit 11